MTAELGHLRVDRSQGKRLEGQPRGLSLQAYHFVPKSPMWTMIPENFLAILLGMQDIGSPTRVESVLPELDAQSLNH